MIARGYPHIYSYFYTWPSGPSEKNKTAVAKNKTSDEENKIGRKINREKQF